MPKSVDTEGMSLWWFLLLPVGIAFAIAMGVIIPPCGGHAYVVKQSGWGSGPEFYTDYYQLQPNGCISTDRGPVCGNFSIRSCN